MGQRTVDEVLTDLNIATEAFMEDVETAINDDNYTHEKLLKKSKAFTGGKKIDIPLKYGRENVQTMDRYGTYTLQPKEIMDEASYDIKHINTDVTLDQKQVEAENIGPAELIDLAEARFENASITLKDKFSQLLFTPVADLDSADLDGLVAIAGTQNNSVGGINGATHTSSIGEYNWNPHVIDYTGVSITYDNLVDSTSTYYIEKLLRFLIGPLTIGSDAPTIGLCSQVIWDAYEEVLKASERYVNKMEVDGGFDVLKFRRMKIAVDSHVPGGKMNEVTDNYGSLYALNEKYIGYRHSPAVKFKATKWKKMERQPAYFMLIDWMGNLICSRRDRQGSILGLPTDKEIYGV